MTDQQRGIAVVLAVALQPLHAYAVCSKTNDWNKANAVAGAANASASTNINDWVFYPVSNKIYARDSGGNALGSVTAGGTIENAPAVVGLPSTAPPASRTWNVFVGSNDGYVYRMQMSGGAMVAAGSRDMRRPGCSADAIEAAPSVQLKSFSNGSFTPNTDLVFVLTHHNCGDYSQNQVVALDANNPAAAPIWTFNEFGEYQMDYGSEGCSIDYTLNRIYCGTNLEAGRAQNTLWAIDTNTGALVWATNANAIHNRPQLGRGTPRHLYVADRVGMLHAYDADSAGTEHWSISLPAAAGVFVESNLWAEFRGDYSQMVFITDTSGTLHAVYDGGGNPDDPAVAWQASFGGAQIKSLGTVSPTLGKLFVGLDNGTVQQLTLGTGAQEASRTVVASVGTNIVSDPTLYLSALATDVDKLVVSSQDGVAGTVTKQFCVPFGLGTTGASADNCTADSDCVQTNTPSGCVPGSASNDCCTLGKCDTTSGTCYGKTVSGGACNDGNACTSNDQCIKGICHGNWMAVCTGPSFCQTYPNEPNRACGPGQICVSTGQSMYTCVDPSSSEDYCGGIGRACTDKLGIDDWGGDRDCVRGRCVRKTTKYCNAPSIAQLNTALTNLNAASLSFNRVPNGPGQPASCYGLFASYTTTYNSSSLVTATFSGCFSCGSTITCSGNSSTYACFGSTQSASSTFTDPNPAAGIQHKARVTVTVQGNHDGSVSCNGTDRFNVFIQNGTTGSITQIGTTGGGSCGCGCVTANPVTKELADWVSGGNYTLVLSSSDGSRWRAATATIRIDEVQNNVYVIDPSGGNTTLPAKTHPGFMHGITTSPFVQAVTGDLAVSFVNDATYAYSSAGRYFGNSGLVEDLPAMPASAPTRVTCPGPGCPYAINAFNFGPSSPSSNGQPVYAGGAGGPGYFFFGNYRQNGDVFAVNYLSGRWNAAPIYQSVNAPWCPAAGCGEADRITAVDFAITPSGTVGNKAYLAIAHGSEVVLFNLGLQSIAATVDLKGASPFRQLSQGGSLNIVGIMGLTSDPLNRTNDVFVEVKELRGAGTFIYYLLQIRGDDLTVRPIGPYRDPAGNMHPGVLNDMNIPGATIPPFDLGNEGRIAATSLRTLHRLVPVDPANVGSAVVQQYSLPP